MEGIQTIQSFISMLDKSLVELTPEVQMLASKPLEEQLQSMKDPLDRAEYLNTISYTLTSLMFAYIKSKGVDTTNSPIMDELARVKSHVQKVKQCREKQKGLDTQQHSQTEQTKKIIQSNLNGRHQEPAISKSNFRGRHKRFSDETSLKNDTKKAKQ
ncbi:unnamed protein product [Kuraishia capsulata CBS 1993]|uniref:Exosome complex protein n=1 Tax=Kuraishia capsulata CBS 1993 TaxID=1382522 RepID=W6MUI8_9ASCO|nr:uncharacterized protein KUCA_T00005305001 [Kuraishia capsulata CBS 1993]CDK29317.1 unnamed protein product [Kuraishia capsulata CBS 1993]